jgi:hypothetical protein
MQEGFMSQSGMVSIHQDFQMSPDMIQEVKVITSSYDAQYGSSTSGQITMVSKSGTSAYHGAAFEYARNAALNAAQWGKSEASHDNEHNFGANFGGPVRIPHLYEGTSKHRSFFYFNWESYHQAGGSNSPTLSIPSLLERQGDFSDWRDSSGNLIPIYVPGTITPACQTALPAGVGPGSQFPGNTIPQNCISPIATAYMAELPTPTNSQPTNNYTLSKPVPDTLTSNSNVYMFRIDHNYGDKDHLYFFWWRQFTGFNTATALPTSIATESPTRPQNSPIARFNWEHTFSSTLTNHVTFGYLNRNEGYGSENLAFVGKLPQVPNAAGTKHCRRSRFRAASTRSPIVTAPPTRTSLCALHGSLMTSSTRFMVTTPSPLEWNGVQCKAIFTSQIMNRGPMASTALRPACRVPEEVRLPDFCWERSAAARWIVEP